MIAFDLLTDAELIAATEPLSPVVQLIRICVGCGLEFDVPANNPTSKRCHSCAEWRGSHHGDRKQSEYGGMIRHGRFADRSRR